MASFQYGFATDPSAQFRGALTTGSGADLDLVLPSSLKGINGNARAQLRSLTIISIQNLAWELWLWGSTTHTTLTAGVTSAGSNVIGRWTFAATDAVQDNNTGDFVYYIDGLDVPYVDLDNSGKLHLTLINRSVTSKLANDAGAIQVRGRLDQPLVGSGGF